MILNAIFTGLFTLFVGSAICSFVSFVVTCASSDTPSIKARGLAALFLAVSLFGVGFFGTLAGRDSSAVTAEAAK